jgi:hypothetical protein
MERSLSFIADMNPTQPSLELAWNGEQPRLAYSLLLFQTLTGCRWTRVASPGNERADLLWIRRGDADEWMVYELSEAWGRLERVQADDHSLETGCFKRPTSLKPDWLLSMVWMALRIEERFGAKDVHGRFVSGESLAARMGVERIPWVHRWAESLAREWGLKVDKTLISKVDISVDVDHLLAFAGRSWWHVGLAGMRDVLHEKCGKALTRLRARAGGVDPYDTLLEQVDLWEGRPWNYFALMQLSRSEQDSGVDFANRRAQSLWKALDQKLNGALGWHPSTGASKGAREGFLEQEYLQVSRLLDREVVRSRFHFLAFEPEIHYPILAGLGIREDHSMGYVDRMGWRAGIAVPYPWFDLEKNVVLDFWVHPFFAMDGHLLYYHPKDYPFDAWKKAYEECTVQGVPFSWVTHWRLFSEVEPEWTGWKENVKMMAQWGEK